MIPLLLIIYIAIELVKYKYGNKLKEKIQKAGNSGLAIGAILRNFPKCGISVIATALYTERLLTIGTLIAVYLATSDEAIPVLLSNPDKINTIFTLISTKIIIAIIGGYSIDFVYRKNNSQTIEHIEAYSQGSDDESHHHEAIIKTKACCNHF